MSIYTVKQKMLSGQDIAVYATANLNKAVDFIRDMNMILRRNTGNSLIKEFTIVSSDGCVRRIVKAEG